MFTRDYIYSRIYYYVLATGSLIHSYHQPIRDVIRLKSMSWALDGIPQGTPVSSLRLIASVQSLRRRSTAERKVSRFDCKLKLILMIVVHRSLQVKWTNRTNRQKVICYPHLFAFFGCVPYWQNIKSNCRIRNGLWEKTSCRLVYSSNIQTKRSR